MVGLSDGQVKHSLLRVSLLTGHEQQGLRLGHPQVHGGTAEATIGHGEGILVQMPLQPRPLRGLLGSLARLSACPWAQELSTARCRREKTPHFKAAPQLR